MKFKFAAVALLASVTLFCSEGFGADLLGRVLGRGCCGCEVSSCEPDCGCEAAHVVEDCGCTEVVDDCGCGSRSGLLSRLGDRNRRGILSGCGPTCPEEAAAPCCEPAPVDCGCEADPCAKRVGLLAKLRARCESRGSNDCGCEVEAAPCCEPAPVVADCGCDAAPACADPCAKRVGLLAKLRARCGDRGCCDTADDCGCEVEAAPCCEPAPAPAPAPCCEPAPVDCGCEADPCAKRVGLLAKLRARCESRGCCEAAADCGCEMPAEPAPAPCCEPAPVVEDCGCEAAPACADPCEQRVGLLNRLRGRLGNRCGSEPAADCGCEVEAAPCCEPAPVADCGCEAEPACGCDAAPSCGGRLRGRLGGRLGGCRSDRGCGASADCGCGVSNDCGCDSGCDDGCSKLTLLDRLRGNRLPRSRGGRVLCGCPNDGCNSPCPGQGCGDNAVNSGCSSCGGDVISYGQPVEAGSSAPVYESAPAQGVVVPNVNEAEGQVVPGDGASNRPVVRPNAFVIRAAR